MPTAKSHRRGQKEKDGKGRLAEKASSFHGRSGGSTGETITRPRTVPDLRAGGREAGGDSPVGRPQLTKLLANVTVQRSLGAVQVVMSLEATVGDLIAEVLRQYAKEGRRPILASNKPEGFDLHYSQFSLESLDREEKLMALGSRNFFLWLKNSTPGSGDVAAEASSSCSKQVDKATKIGLAVPWLQFMDFLL